MLMTREPPAPLCRILIRTQSRVFALCFVDVSFPMSYLYYSWFNSLELRVGFVFMRVTWLDDFICKTVSSFISINITSLPIKRPKILNFYKQQHFYISLYASNMSIINVFIILKRYTCFASDSQTTIHYWIRCIWKQLSPIPSSYITTPL